jgi:hypothetical protein
MFAPLMIPMNPQAGQLRLDLIREPRMLFLHEGRHVE